MDNLRLLSILLLLYSAKLYSVEQIEVQALMTNMAVLMVDGERVTLRPGNVSEHGLKLISADSKSAVIEINGEHKIYKMGTTVSTSFSQRESTTEQVIIDRMGMFRAHGSINNQSVKFLIDTGATSVAMSAKDARKLGIQYRLNGRPTRTHTASGVAKAWAITLKSVSLGKLSEKNVQGVVIDGNYPRHVLLGMSFLNRMKVEKEGSKMVITKKH